MPVGAKLRRLVLTAAGIVLAAGAVQAQPAQHETAPERTAPKPAVLAAIEGPIGPASESHVEDVIEAARERNAEVLILRLDTPGGLATSMRKIIALILASPVPVVGYVAPPGAHAASAGTYILYATHVAAMAPGTNLGAATPVQIGGGGLPGQPSPEDREREDEEDEDGRGDDAGAPEDDDARPRRSPSQPMEAKAVNDAVAFIRSLAELHGRNADWAEKAVREAASLSATKARDMNVVDLVADDVEALLAAIDGRVVKIAGIERTLATRDLRVERIEAGWITKVLSVLSNPNVAFLLMMVGVYGLIFEIISPGAIFPGVIGGICLLLGLYALNQLPLDYAGLALVVFGLALMVAEAFTPTFGVLGLGGMIAFIIGAAMLIDTEAPQYRLSWWVIGTTAAATALAFAFVVASAWRAHRRPAAAGASRTIGAEAKVLDWSEGEGHVWAEGERWRARGDRDLGPGQRVRIERIDGLTLIVGPAAEGPPDGHPDRQKKGA